jgi:hypothetical protein
MYGYDPNKQLLCASVYKNQIVKGIRQATIFFNAGVADFILTRFWRVEGEYLFKNGS